MTDMKPKIKGMPGLIILKINQQKRRDDRDNKIVGHQELQKTHEKTKSFSNYLS